MRWTSLVAAALLISCTPYNTPAPHTPAQAVAKPDSFAKAKRVLIGYGMSIEDSDESAGVISTTWVEDAVFTGARRRMRWVVTIDDTFVTVASQCQMAASGGGPGQIQECEAQPEVRNTQAQEIADAIGR